ncbi:MAG: hypothetical protein HOW73_14560 [Polyangiaceae bacterium]|nr:hypothetical protein [Polyangiaceae bacterium]
MTLPSSPSPNDPNVQQGADVLATRCLCVSPGERVHLITWKLEELNLVVERALIRAGATVERIRLETMSDPAAVRAALGSQLHGATASLLVAADGIPVPIGVAVLDVIRRAGSRHLHVTRTDPRVFAQSMRAEPERLGMLNDRVASTLAPPTRIRVTSPAGTQLELALASQYPILSSSGRPKLGEIDNLPAGFVYAHPSVVSGTFVADRGLLGTGMRLTGAALRKSPVYLEFGSGRVVKVTCSDATITEQVQAFLARHSDAGRVGAMTFPTNYLVRSEIGLGIQDALLPGLSLALGTSHASVTKAPYDCPVQLRLFGRRLTVDADGKRLVEDGRFADWLVEGIDPFR